MEVGGTDCEQLIARGEVPVLEAKGPMSLQRLLGVLECGLSSMRLAVWAASVAGPCGRDRFDDPFDFRP